MPTSPIPVIDLETNTIGHVITGSPAWEDLVLWVDAHGIAPKDVFARDGITRDAERGCIRFTTWVCDEAGRRTVDPGTRQLQHQQVVVTTDGRPRPLPDTVVQRMFPRPARTRRR